MTQSACDAFLEVADQFQLGSLTTEQPHPLTIRLSYETQNDLKQALGSLKLVDTLALEKLKTFSPDIAAMGRAVRETLEAGNKLFLCGCGATGRLSISLEVFARSGMLAEKHRDQVISFMAGGDTALTKTIENFEDYPHYGERQLIELGFGKQDLLISTTEGGETPFVIGATEAAARLSNRKPWFLFCNPVEELLDKIERSTRVLRNPNIHCVSLSVGPMGLSGSTRMQASTVLMAAAGYAMWLGGNQTAIEKHLERLYQTWKSLLLDELAEITQAEAAVYPKGEYVIYQTETAGVTVLTDTTERSPTFSLPPFENEFSPGDPTTWCYLCIPSAKTSLEAWESILKRPPRCQEWKETQALTGLAMMKGFHVGGECYQKRAWKTGNAVHHRFEVSLLPGQAILKFQGSTFVIRAGQFSEFELNLLLKMVLNIHSTALMGIMGRFESNLMTYVRPTNNKLVDRTIRYVQRLNKLQGKPPLDYALVARRLFQIADTIPADEPMVLRLLDDMTT